MSISLRVGSIDYEIGGPDFLKSFFSTVYVRLENRQWGASYPKLMNELYVGRLSQAAAERALQELDEIEDRLRKYSPTEVVWDFEDATATPPWGSNISNTITDLSKYFWTAAGENLFDVLRSALKESKRAGRDVRIE